MKNNFSLLLVLVILILPVEAQVTKGLTGNLSSDSKVLFEESNLQSLPQLSFQTESSGKKSPLLAGLLSFVIPGAGEFYAGNYLKTAIFVAIEAAVITTAVVYDNKGNDQTDKFEKYADENWSVVRYAEWLVQYKGADRSKIIISEDESLVPWERVNWNELNAAEDEAAKTGGGFTHKLPSHGLQQYYELIGKYHEYSPGWNDYSSSGNTTIVSPNFTFYSGQRGKANDYYNVASKAVIGIYINHFLSVIDAVWTTVQYNNSLAMKVRLEEVYLADRMELVPTLKFSYGF